MTCSGVVGQEHCQCTQFAKGSKQAKKCVDCRHAKSSHPSTPLINQPQSSQCKGVVGKSQCRCSVFVQNASDSDTVCDDCGHTRGAHSKATQVTTATGIVEHAIKAINRDGIAKLTARTSTEAAVRETNAGLKRTPLDIDALMGVPPSGKAGSVKFKVRYGSIIVYSTDIHGSIEFQKELEGAKACGARRCCQNRSLSIAANGKVQNWDMEG